jgi:hypothetical protein
MIKKVLAASIVLLAGCTSAQVATLENDLHAGTVAAHNAVVAVEDNEGTIEEAVTKLAEMAPKSALIQKAIADAQAAIAALKNHQGTVDKVLEALAVVEKLSAPDPAQKAIPKRIRKKKVADGTAPVTSGSK